MNINKFTYKGAIFDLDGTLTDSMWIWDTVILHWLERRQLRCDAVVSDLTDATMCMTFDESAKYIVRHLGLDMPAAAVAGEWKSMLIDDYRMCIPLKEGVRDFLRRLSSDGIRMCVATSNFREACAAVLEAHKINNYFDFIITSDEVGKNKNSPDIYLTSAKKMGLTPRECMVFEDITPAVCAAKSAGFQTTGVYDAHAGAEGLREIADNYIVSFRGILA